METKLVCCVCGSQHDMRTSSHQQPLCPPMDHRYCLLCRHWHIATATICGITETPIVLLKAATIGDSYVFMRKL